MPDQTFPTESLANDPRFTRRALSEFIEATAPRKFQPVSGMSYRVILSSDSGLQLREVPHDKIKRVHYAVRAGEILLSRLDPSKGFFEVAPRWDMALVNSDFHVLRLDRWKARAEFILPLLNRPQILAELTSKLTTGKKPHLRLRDLLDFVVPVPPLFMQTEALKLLFPNR